MFWHKKRLTSDEYEKIIRRVIGLEADMDRVKALFDNLRTSVSSLRGIFNRKIGGGDDRDDSTTPSGIDDGFNELRKLNKDRSS